MPLNGAPSIGDNASHSVSAVANAIGRDGESHQNPEVEPPLQPPGEDSNVVDDRDGSSCDEELKQPAKRSKQE